MQHKFYMRKISFALIALGAVFQAENLQAAKKRSVATAVAGDQARSRLYETMRFFDANGKEHTLKSWSKNTGKPVLLIVWASWCGPCLKEMPSVQRLKHSPLGQYIDILPVAIEAPISGHAYKLDGISMPLYYSESLTSFLAQEGMHGIPTALLYDGKGRLIFKETGAKEWDSSSNARMLMRLLKLKSSSSTGKRAR